MRETVRKKKLKNNQKGITLIVLVITIIVLLILAGIVISMLSGENGVLTKAAKAKKAAQRGQELENIQLAITASLVNNNHKVDRATLEQELKRNMDKANLIDLNDEFVIEIGENIYIIDSNGNLNEGPYNKGTARSDAEVMKLYNLSSGKIIDYKIYGNTIQSALPSEYQQVEYIKSTGTQCINTEYIPKTNTRIECELSFEGEFNNKACGSILGTSDEENVFAVNFGGEATEGNILYNWVDKFYQQGATIYNIRVSDKIRTNRNLFTLQSEKVSYGDISKTIATKTEDQTESLILFGKRNVKGIFAFEAYNMIVYSFKIYEDDNLIKDMLPCYRRSDGKVGMYDLIEGKFYSNVFADEFVKPDGEKLSVGDIVTEGEYKGKYNIPVIIRSKNIFDIDMGLNSNLSKNPDGTYKIEHKSSGRGSGEIPIYIPANTSFAKSVEIIDFSVTPNTYKSIPITVKFADGTIAYKEFFSNTAGKPSSSYYVDKFEKDVVAIQMYLHSGSDVGSYITFKNIQVEIGSQRTSYESYSKQINIYLDEPLRQIGNHTDYIDFENRKIVRQVEVLEDGTLKGLKEEIVKDIKLPTIPTYEGINIITVDTIVKPSNFEIKYITK